MVVKMTNQNVGASLLTSLVVEPHNLVCHQMSTVNIELFEGEKKAMKLCEELLLAECDVAVTSKQYEEAALEAGRLGDLFGLSKRRFSVCVGDFKSAEMEFNNDTVLRCELGKKLKEAVKLFIENEDKDWSAVEEQRRNFEEQDAICDRSEHAMLLLRDAKDDCRAEMNAAGEAYTTCRKKVDLLFELVKRKEAAVEALKKDVENDGWCETLSKGADYKTECHKRRVCEGYDCDLCELEAEVPTADVPETSLSRALPRRSKRARVDFGETHVRDLFD